MDFTPTAVSSHLYSGIWNDMERLFKVHRSNGWGDLESTSLYDIRISIEWYNKHCVLSAKYLQEKYDELIAEIGSNYFIYNLYLHHRFTVKYQLAGEQFREEYNCLFDRSIGNLRQVSDIAVGKIIMHKGLALRVTEVFDNIDKKFGRFIAETFSVEEQIELKRKGGY